MVAGTSAVDVAVTAGVATATGSVAAAVTDVMAVAGIVTVAAVMAGAAMASLTTCARPVLPPSGLLLRHPQPRPRVVAAAGVVGAAIAVAAMAQPEKVVKGANRVSRGRPVAHAAANPLPPT